MRALSTVRKNALEETEALPIARFKLKLIK